MTNLIYEGTTGANDELQDQHTHNHHHPHPTHHNNAAAGNAAKKHN